MSAERLTGSPVIHVSRSAAAKVAKLAQTISADPALDPVGFITQARLASRKLPHELWEPLELFRLHGSESGILVFRGLPARDVPPTPPDNTHHLGATTEAARIAAVINSALGDMISYEAECNGRLCQDMVPAESKKDTQTSLSSRTELEVHTEQAFSPLMPDFLSLFCLRGHPDAATYVFPATDLLQHLTDAELRLLRRPYWTFGVDESFRVGNREFLAGDVRGPAPVFSGPEEDPSLLFDQDLQHGITKAAHALFEKVIGLYCAHRRSHVLEPGDMLLLDNMRAIHGRSAFTARFDGTDRFILRSFVVRDLGRSRHARVGNGRAIAARYS